MDGHTFLSWNIPNVVTVWLMIALGVVILRFGGTLWQKRASA